MTIEKFALRFSELNIERNALVSAMGYTNDSLPTIINEDIDEVLGIGDELCEICGGYRITDTLDWDKSNFNMTVEDVPLDIDKIIFQQIKKSSSLAIFACTAGKEITHRSKVFMSEGDMLKGYVYDLFGSVVVESAMDIIHSSLRQRMASSGLKITNRYSPGYCGWQVAGQKNLFSLLPEHFCGIELTDSCLMRPTKSVSGIIGIGESVKFNEYTCSICHASNCLYRNLIRR